MSDAQVAPSLIDATVTGRHATLTLSPGAVLKTLALITLALCLVGAATIPIAVAAAKQDLPAALRYRLFMLDEERALPTWFSTMLLAANMLLLAVNAAAARRRGERDGIMWLILAGIFAFLSFDEMVSIHETVGASLKARFQLDGFLRFAWVIPGAAFAVLVGLGFAGFLRRLLRQTALLFVLSGMIYISGALITEAVEAFVVSTLGRGYLYFSMVVFEEGMEMLGQSVFCFALLQHLSLVRAKLILGA
jgi:hypothetical protein